MPKAFALIPLALLAACSSSSPKMMMVNTTPLPITVLDGNTQSPMPQVSVAVDDAKGTRVEGTTDSTGVTTVMVDWTQAPVSITSWSDGYTVASYLAQPQSAKFTVYLLPLSAPTGTAVTGSIGSKDMGSDVATLTPSVWGSSYQNTTLTYSLTIYDDKPYSIFGLDWVVGTKPSARGIAQTFKKWVQVDAPAPSSSASVDFDFAAGTPLTAIDGKGSITIPGGSSGPFANSTGYVSVTDLDSYYSAFLGAPTVIDVSSDGTQLTYNMEHVEPASITKPITGYAVSGTAGAFSLKNAMGWPTDGESITDLLAPPVVSPAPSGMLPFGQAPEFTAPTGDVSIFLQVLANGGSRTQTVLWYVYGPTGTPLVPPMLPSAADPAVVLPPGQLSGQIVACGPAKSLACTYYAVSDRFKFSR